jgi:hypothetical protein
MENKYLTYSIKLNYPSQDYHESGHYTFPDFYLNHDVSETGFCLHLHVEPTDMANLKTQREFGLPNVVF